MAINQDNIYSWDEMLKSALGNTDIIPARPYLVFLHIPKTAGTTFEVVASRNYNTGTFFYYGGKVEDYVSTYQNMSPQQKAYHRAIGGHAGLYTDFHLYVPQKFVHLTFLRNPVELVISYYYYTLSEPQTPNFSKVSAKGYTLTHFAREFNNTQTFYLANDGSASDTADPLTRAKRNLTELFSFFGLVERFNESLVLMHKAIKWDDLFYVSKNKGKLRPPGEEISKSAIEEIRKYNQLDMELYRYASDLYASRIAQLGTSFVEEVKLFQLFNAQYGNLVTSYNSIPSGGSVVNIARLCPTTSSKAKNSVFHNH